MIWLYISGLVIPWIFYFIDLLGNNFDANFSKGTLKKLRVKDDSFLRKIIPLKEGDIIKNNIVRGYRYYLYPRVLALFIQTIVVLLGFIALILYFVFNLFILGLVLGIIGGILLGLWIIYTLIMNALSQGFHI